MLSRLISTKLVNVFKPHNGLLGAIARRPTGGNARLRVDIHGYEGDYSFVAEFNSRSRTNFTSCDTRHLKPYSRSPTFLPTKEVISFIRDIVARYGVGDTAVDDTYRDLCHDLDLNTHDESDLEERAKWALDEIENLCCGTFDYNGGQVVFKEKRSQENHSNTMIAEGHRKLGVLHRLLENQVLSPSVSGPLFWDEPEANLNPKLMNLVVRILLELARLGQQVILTTHNYVLMKELEIERRDSDSIKYHALYRKTGNGRIMHSSASDYAQLSQNSIADTFSSLYDRDLEKSVARMEQ